MFMDVPLLILLIVGGVLFAALIVLGFIWGYKRITASESDPKIEERVINLETLVVEEQKHKDFERELQR